MALKRADFPLPDLTDERTAEYFAGAANKIYGQTIPVSKPGLDLTLREPIGVVGLIVPWNFPILMASWKVAPALGLTYGPTATEIVHNLSTAVIDPRGKLAKLLVGPAAKSWQPTELLKVISSLVNELKSKS